MRVLPSKVALATPDAFILFIISATVFPNTVILFPSIVKEPDLIVPEPAVIVGSLIGAGGRNRVRIVNGVVS